MDPNERIRELEVEIERLKELLEDQGIPWNPVEFKERYGPPTMLEALTEKICLRLFTKADNFLRVKKDSWENQILSSKSLRISLPNSFSIKETL
jgi:hypothetical protein